MLWASLVVVGAVLCGARGTPCTLAQQLCAYRTGCGAALSSYMEYCADVLSTRATYCPEHCQHALIALNSTEEGKELMSCQCEDEYCQETKIRINVCRPQVMRTVSNATTSCRLSQMICSADAQCATALDYYNRLCRSMFHGRKCSNKCLNSINILRKQEKAAMLTNCKCDGLEGYDCPQMQSNIARLCFHKKKPVPKRQEEERTTLAPTAGVSKILPRLIAIPVLYYFLVS